LGVVSSQPRPTAAEVFRPLLRAAFGPELSVGVRYWDNSVDGPAGREATLVFHDPGAFRRVLYQPNELGLGRAYIEGGLSVDGDEEAALRALQQGAPARAHVNARRLAASVIGAARLGMIGLPLPAPPEEARLHGHAHSPERDTAAVTHHYDVGNDFYRLVLGESMTYSCARFVSPDDTLETAQAAKYDLICAKLGLAPGMRLLDVGCGWGGMAMHAAARYGVDVVGITLSGPQADLARSRVAAAGLSDRVEIRIQDYRDLTGEPATFHAVSSIGMFEHVGQARMADYFGVLERLLNPRGRLLNHAISAPGGSKLGPRSFVGRYVFPDGELQDVAKVITALQHQHLEVRDIESLREHYALTLRRWVANLDANWEAAIATVGPRRARVWRLYMLGSILGFESGGIAIHQVLAVKPDATGASGMPSTRRAMA